MSDAPLINAIQGRLRNGGYTDLVTPFKLAGVDFVFTGAMLGSAGRALDLVLLFDTTAGDFGDLDMNRVRQRVEALSRALDITGSRYVVTVILAGFAGESGIEALAETCRVLQVDGIELRDGKPASEAAARQLEDRVRVLLPLTLPPLIEARIGSDPAIEKLREALPALTDSALIDAVIGAASTGEQAVTDAVAQIINQAFYPDADEAQS